jgi:anti-sigma regulatory factor (Ser/Thr protein kinase)
LSEQRLALHSDLAEMTRIPPWIEAIRSAGGWPEALSFAVLICLEEAVSNIIRFGHVDQAGIVIAIADGPDTVELTIEHRGDDFDPTRYPEPAAAPSLAEASVGGQGIHLMRRFATEMDYQRISDLNRLRFLFRRDAT